MSISERWLARIESKPIVSEDFCALDITYEPLRRTLETIPIDQLKMGILKRSEDSFCDLFYGCYERFLAHNIFTDIVDYYILNPNHL